MTTSAYATALADPKTLRDALNSIWTAFRQASRPIAQTFAFQYLRPFVRGAPMIDVHHGGAEKLPFEPVRVMPT
jgi:hypothetical protein